MVNKTLKNDKNDNVELKNIDSYRMH